MNDLKLDELNPGDPVTYIRTGDFGGPCTRHHATFLGSTEQRCHIQLISGTRRRVKRASLVKGWSTFK